MPFRLPGLLYDIPRSLPFAIGLPLALGFASGKVTQKSVKTWYPTLNKPPPGPPPNWVFPVVWTSLYAGMGWASHIAVKALDLSPSIAVRAAASSALTLYWVQLGLNMAWSQLFFGMRQPVPALVDIVALLGTVAALTPKMARVDRRTLFVFVPYVAWLSFATYLNGGIVYLNGGKEQLAQAEREAKDGLDKAERKGREQLDKGKAEANKAKGRLED